MIFGYDIDATYIIAQLAGFVAMGFGMYSYQTKKRVSILTLQAFSNIFWLIQYLLLGRYSAVAANVIGVLRNIIYLCHVKNKPIIAAFGESLNLNTYIHHDELYYSF